MTVGGGIGGTPVPTSRPTAGRAPSHARWIAVALVLFPTAWRDRFGVEFGALLDQTPMSRRVLFDVLVAAVDAHVHPTGPRRRWPLMIERLRISELTVFASWVVFVVAGLAFQRFSEAGPVAEARNFQGSVALAYAAIIGGAIVSLAAMAVAGVPVALAIARRAVRHGDRRTLGLLAVPPISLALWVGLTVLLLSFNISYESPWQLVFFLIWTGTFGLAALASTVAVSAAALDAEIDASLYRRAVVPAVVTATAMAAVVTAVIAWGIALAVVSPAAFWGSDGYFATSTPLNWLAIVIVMAAATATGVRAAVRVRRESGA